MSSPAIRRRSSVTTATSSLTMSATTAPTSSSPSATRSGAAAPPPPPPPRPTPRGVRGGGRGGRAGGGSSAEVDFEGKYYRIEKGKLNVPFVAPDRTRPEIFLGGNSARAEGMAVKYADCLWRLPDKPDVLRQRTPDLIEKGIEVGLLVSLIVRPTRREALAATEKLLEEVGGRPRRTHEEFAKRSDSVAFTSTYELAAKNDVWLTDYLWSGAVPFLGAPAMAIVGSPEDVADALFEFRAAGITQFLFMGWPDMEEMTNFHGEVLPLVRAREAAEQYGNYIAQD